MTFIKSISVSTLAVMGSLGVLSAPAFADAVDDFAALNECAASQNPGGGNAYGQGQTVIFRGGVADNYVSANAEGTTPRADLAALQYIINYQTAHGRPTISRDYDERHQNEWFIETLDIPNGHKMKKGWVLFKARNFGGLSHNDVIYFGNVVDVFNESGNPTGPGGAVDRDKYRAFGHRINTLTVAVNGNGTQMFTTDPVTGITYGSLEEVELFSSAGGTPSLLDQIHEDRFMDVSLQDDTEVDFVAVVGCMTGNAQNNGNRREFGKSGGNGKNSNTTIPSLEADE